MGSFAHEHVKKNCPGGARLDATLDTPLATFWEHDLGVLALGNAAFGVHNDSVAFRYAFVSVGTLLIDSYPTSPFTTTYAQNAVVLGDGTLAKNTSGAWETEGCAPKNRSAAATCHVIWAEDAVLSVTLLAQMLAQFGPDQIGTAAATAAVQQLFGATKRLRVDSGPMKGLYAHAYNIGAKTRSCCAPAAANGALALAHIRLGAALEQAMPTHPKLPQLRAAVVALADVVLRAQRHDGLWTSLLAAGDAVPPPTVDMRAESTGSAWLVAALAAGAKIGWLTKQHADAARKGFAALTALVDEASGSIRSTAPSDAGYLLLGAVHSSAAEYVAQPLGTAKADVAVGAMLLAAAAVGYLGQVDVMEMDAGDVPALRINSRAQLKSPPAPLLLGVTSTSASNGSLLVLDSLSGSVHSRVADRAAGATTESAFDWDSAVLWLLEDEFIARPFFRANLSFGTPVTISLDDCTARGTCFMGLQWWPAAKAIVILSMGWRGSAGLFLLHPTNGTVSRQLAALPAKSFGVLAGATAFDETTATYYATLDLDGHMSVYAYNVVTGVNTTLVVLPKNQFPSPLVWTSASLLGLVDTQLVRVSPKGLAPLAQLPRDLRIDSIAGSMSGLLFLSTSNMSDAANTDHNVLVLNATAAHCSLLRKLSVEVPLALLTVLDPLTKRQTRGVHTAPVST